MKEIIELLKEARNEIGKKGFDFYTIDMEDLDYQLQDIIAEFQSFDKNKELKAKMESL